MLEFCQKREQKVLTAIISLQRERKALVAPHRITRVDPNKRENPLKIYNSESTGSRTCKTKDPSRDKNKIVHCTKKKTRLNSDGVIMEKQMSFPIYRNSTSEAARAQFSIPPGILLRPNPLYN